VKGSISSDITPYGQLKVSARFHADFLLGLFFDPENGGDIFLQNVV
jgi:hypothetical protein